MQSALFEEGSGPAWATEGTTLHALIAREMGRRARRGWVIDWHPLSWDTEKATEKSYRLFQRINGRRAA